MIYLIQNTVTGLCKVGYSKRPKSRLSQLQTSCADTLALLEVIEGGIPEEQELHRLFAADRVRGEWFTFSAALLAVFEAGAVEMPEESKLDKREARKEMVYLVALGERLRKTKCRLNVTGSPERTLNALIEAVKSRLPERQHNFYLQTSDVVLSEVQPGQLDPDYRGKHVLEGGLFFATEDGQKIPATVEEVARCLAQHAYDKRYKAILRDNPPHGQPTADGRNRFMRPIA